MKYRGDSLNTSPECFGILRCANDARGDRAELQRRMDRDGYLYLPGLLNEDDVLDAQREIMERLP